MDGTTNLIHNFHFSAISLALYEGGQVVFGVVYHPYSDSCFTATRGGGSFLNGQPISVSSATQLSQCLASVGTVPGRRDLGETAFRQLWTLYNACQDVRRMGCASLDLSFVACGRQDIYVEPALKPWDYAAGLLLVEEAGGKVNPARRKPHDAAGGLRCAGLQRPCPPASPGGAAIVGVDLRSTRGRLVAAPTDTLPVFS